MADTALILGVVGVVGTFAGTLGGARISARATSKVEDRREQRAEREQAEATRAAARLVWLDLAVCDGNLLWAASRRKWHPDKVRLPTAAWEAYKDRLAVALANGTQWDTVATAIAALEHVKALAYLMGDEDGNLHEAEAENCEAAQRLLVDAAEILAPVAGMPAPSPVPPEQP